MSYVDPNHDYTNEVEVSIEDIVLEQDAAPDQTAEKINEENSFPPPPPGRHKLRIIRFNSKVIGGRPETKIHRVFLPGPNGVMEEVSFESPVIRVSIGMVDSPRKQVTDIFYAPPTDPRQLQAYREGRLKKEDTNVGFYSKKYFHFLGYALGFKYKSGDKLPFDAMRLKSWMMFRDLEGNPFVDGNGDPIYRTFYGKVTAEGTYEDKVTKEKKVSQPQIKSFSYEPDPACVPPEGYTQGGAGAKIVSHSQPAARPAARPAPKPEPVMAGAGVGSGDGNGLDDI